MVVTQRHSNFMSIGRIIRFIWAFCLIVFPIILLFLPSTYFDSGHTICLITIATGHECYGCGLTRSIMHLIHFDFMAAWDYNKIGFIVFPIICVLYLEMILRNMHYIGIIKSNRIILFFDKYLYNKRKNFTPTVSPVRNTHGITK